MNIIQIKNYSKTNITRVDILRKYGELIIEYTPSFLHKHKIISVVILSIVISIIIYFSNGFVICFILYSFSKVFKEDNLFERIFIYPIVFSQILRILLTFLKKNLIIILGYQLYL